MEIKTLGTKDVRQKLGGYITELKFTDNLFLIEKNKEIVGGLVSLKFLKEAGVKLPSPETKEEPQKKEAAPDHAQKETSASTSKPTTSKSK